MGERLDDSEALLDPDKPGWRRLYLSLLLVVNGYSWPWAKEYMGLRDGARQ
jgi:hypothetical protein